MNKKSQKKFLIVNLMSGKTLDQIVEQTFFDETLNIVEKQFYLDGELDSKVLFEYNSENLIQNRITYNSKDEVIHHLEYFYDKDKLIKITEALEYGPGNQIVFEYDSNQKILKEIETNSNGLVMRQLSYNYEESILTTEEFRIDGERMMELIEFKNDDWITIKEIERSFFEGEIDEEISVYEFDKNFNKTKMKTFSESKLVLEETYSFNSHGIEIGSVGVDYEEEENLVVTRKVNLNGDILEEKRTMNNDMYCLRVCEYNKHNDLIKEKLWEAEDGNQKEIDLEYSYVIEYY